MKKKEFMQIKGSDLKELKAKAMTLKNEIADLTLDKNMKKLKDLKLISKKRKERAQILTLLKQKELLLQLESRVESLESGKEVSKEEKISKKSKARKEEPSH